jgi:hypothetical protein
MPSWVGVSGWSLSNLLLTDVATMNNLIFNQGAFAGGVFAGDIFISSFWGISWLMNCGGNAIPNGSLGRGYDGNLASCTIHVRTGATAAFDKKLFTIRGNGVMILCNDSCCMAYNQW